MTLAISTMEKMEAATGPMRSVYRAMLVELLGSESEMLTSLLGDAAFADTSSGHGAHAQRHEHRAPQHRHGTGDDAGDAVGAVDAGDAVDADLDFD